MVSWFPNLISLFLRRRAPRSGSKTVRFSGSRTSRARAVHGLRHLATEAARLRIQEALIGFRTVARKCGQRRLCEGHRSPGLRLMAGSARLQFLAFAGFPGRYRPKPEPFIRARQARRHAGR